MNFIERLQYFMEKKGINDNQMTVNAGLSVGLIGKAKVSGKGMSSMNIEKILLAYPELSADWLLTGAGSMLKDDLNGIKTIDEANSSLPCTNAHSTTSNMAKSMQWCWIPSAPLKSSAGRRIRTSCASSPSTPMTTMNRNSTNHASSMSLK